MRAVRLDEAKALVRDGEARARELRVAMNIAIVDPAGHPVHFVRMDEAWLGSIDLAFGKARTAAYFRMSSATLGTLSQPGGPIYGIEHSNGGLVTFGGGLPIIDASGAVIGAVGVSGGNVEQDEAVANAVVSTNPAR